MALSQALHVQVGESSAAKASSSSKAGPSSSSKPKANKKRRKDGDDEDEVGCYISLKSMHRNVALNHTAAIQQNSPASHKNILFYQLCEASTQTKSVRLMAAS